MPPRRCNPRSACSNRAGGRGDRHQGAVRPIGLDNAIAFDMGGTTAKAGVIHRGQVLMTGGALVGGYATGLPLQIPMIDIQEVGTGGGSIARAEIGGALRVGPQSAGAEPGPVCYGQGRHRADRDRRQSGPRQAWRRPVSRRRDDARCRGGAARPADKVARPLGLGLTEAAEGILRVVTTKMAHVVRWVTTERGLDAADFALVAYGGAGPSARRRGGARIAHRAGRDPARAGPFLGLWHADRRSAAGFRHDLVYPARGGVVCRDEADIRGDGTARP